MIRTVTVALLLLAPAPASAELFAVPFAGVKFGGSTSIFDLELAADATKFTMGGALMNVSQGIFGYEVSFGYVPGYFERGDNTLVNPGSFVIDLSGGAVFALPPGATGGGLRPYAVAGAGLAHAQTAEFLGVLQVRRTVPIMNVGVGAIGLVTNTVGVRFDYRYIRSLTSDDGSLSQVGRRLTFSRFTFGLLLRL